MRIKITLAAVLLALGFATITTARQGAEGARNPAPGESKASLRPKLARLRAEVELMQLEHEADVSILKDLVKDLKNLEMMKNAQNSRELAPLLDELRKQGEGLQPILPAIPARFAEQFKHQAENEEKAKALVDEATLKLGRVAYDDFKKGFVERSTALNEKQLELLDLEQRMSLLP
jgi:hypothetical protein